ncbi:hypothetical protein KP509_01G049800 [Ceratopteris richardii]|uniref:Glycosylphosphatidylinositol anchor attachment 1 protein n=1 Tax=Ceratopteris richardii TaxID=49495 RepID=A0A8T2VCU1_CERRI|nr:hypothetical protein KP509_01G049800 [Ceratopteris richardii]
MIDKIVISYLICLLRINYYLTGSASPKFAIRDAMNAAQFARDLQALRQNVTDRPRVVRSFLINHLVAINADFYVHAFYPPEPPFSSLNFFSSHPSYLRSSVETNEIPPENLGVNIAGIIRAPRGEGIEVIVLVTPFDAESFTDADAVSLGLSLSLFQLLSKSPWLAKDIVLLIADSRYSAHSAVSAWLKEYYEPFSFGGPLFHGSTSQQEFYARIMDAPFASLLKESTLADFKRAGVISAGLVFDMQGVQGRLLSDFLTVHAEGPNGQMPNLDLINVINNLAVYREGLQMKLDMATNILEWAWLGIIGQILETLGHFAAMINEGWKFGSPAFEYVQGAATLARSVMLQAFGVPTGVHGAFRDYQIDAVTVIMTFAQAHGGQVGSLLKFGRLVEGTIRSVNNLLEKFHQSFFLYFLAGPSRFVSVGIYTIPLMLLLVTLPLKAAAVCVQRTECSAQATETSSPLQASSIPVLPARNFTNWLFAVLTVCVIELWALTVTIFPPIANYLADTSELKVTVWGAYSSLSCLLCFMVLVWVSKLLGIPNSFGSSWTSLKASTLGLATIGVGIMSPINFAAALAGVIVLVPMCFLACPFRKQKGMFQFFLGLALCLFCTLLVSLFYTEQPKLTLAMLWEWVECQWKWGSATYLYLSLVHLPCSVLSMILLVCNPDK